MKNKEMLQGAMGQLLDAGNDNSAKKVIEDVATIYAEYHQYSNEAPVDANYEAACGCKQVVCAAMSELACRTALKEMSGYFEKAGSLVPAVLPEHMVKFAGHPPATRRFLQTMDFWFGAALKGVFDDAKAGVVPHSAIYNVAPKVHAHHLRGFEKWRRESRRPLAVEARSWPPPSPVFEPALQQTFALNFSKTEAMVVGRGAIDDPYEDTAAADMEVARPEKFAVQPDEFLQLAGFKGERSPITHAKLFLAAGSLIAKDLGKR